MKKAELTIFDTSLPVNPNIYLGRIAEIINNEGFNKMNDDRVKACLWRLITLAYDNLWIKIDCFEEWFRLKKSLLEGVKNE